MPKFPEKLFDIQLGFTIIEILIAISLVAIISTISYTYYEGNTRKHIRDAHRINDVNKIKVAIEAYFEKNNQYPPASHSFDSTDGSALLTSANIPTGSTDWIPELVPTFEKDLPKDPKQTSFNPVKQFAQLFKNKLKMPNLSQKNFQILPDAQAASTITLDTKATLANCAVSAPQWAHTISSTNEVLLVHTQNSTQPFVNTVTWTVGTTVQSLTLSGSAGTPTQLRIYKLTNPTVGAGAIKITWTGSPSIPASASCASTSWKGVNISNPALVPYDLIQSTGSGTSTTLSRGITGSQGGLIVDTLMAKGSTNPIPGSGQIAQITNPLLSVSQKDSCSVFQADNTASWSWTTNVAWDYIPVSLQPAVAGSGNCTPSVTTLAATNVTSASGTLNGSAKPFGNATTGYFRYSTANPGSCNDTFGTRVPSSGGTALGSGSSAVSYSQAISSLTPSTTYYFCAIASNSYGTGFGGIQPFTTAAPSPTPTVSTSPATSVTATGATLNGSANPNGLTTTGWFRYSTTNPGSCNNSFGTATASSGLGSGNSTVPIPPQTISGLTINTTYYFCAIASSSAGTGYGTVLTFRTGVAAGYYYLYYVSSDRKTYSVWATLEDTNDPQINTKPNAACKASLPPGASGQNYCGGGF